MAEASLTINFTPLSSSVSRDCLKIEQEPWGKDVGETTNMQGVAGIVAAITGSLWPDRKCGANGIGEFTATVYVYSCENIGRNYQFKVSHGSVSGRTIETAYREELVQCSMQLEHNTDYPVKQIATTAWIGHCYDERGTMTGRPEVDISDDGKITLSKKVWGSLRIRYTVERHIYEVTINRRFGALENKYVSVAYAVWDGGIKWIDIDAPANFEEFDGDCENGAYWKNIFDENGNLIGNNGQGTADICGHRYRTVPTAVSADRNITVDYCTQEVTGDSVSERVEDDETTDVGDCPDD